MTLGDGAEKGAEIIKFALQNPPVPRVFIETGTNYGHTLMAVAEKNLFGHHFSMEIYHPAYLNCLQSTWHLQRMTVIYADSGIHLPRLLNEVNQTSFFWLDAHGAEPDSPSPLEAELNAIFSDSVNGHVIMIDDYRCFESYIYWPRPEWIEELALSNDYSYTVENDIIRLAPAWSLRTDT